MGLKGSLRDFGISEILQLIGLQHKSGTLTIKSPQAQYQLLISSGKIVKVEKAPELAGESIQDYLVRAKVLSQEQVRNALQKAKAELKPLEEVLTDLDLISLPDLKVFVGLRNVDLINALFLLKDGEYEFDQGPVSYHPNFAAELDTEQLLMDGYRIKDELPSISREVGSLDTVFHKKAGEFGLEEHLDAFEDAVYRLVDGQKDSKDISALARISRFDALKILAELKKKGRIESKAVSREEESPRFSAEAVSRIGFWVLVGVAALLFLNGARVYIARSGLPANPDYDLSWQAERMRESLEIFRLDQGAYPPKLDELVSKGFLPAQDLKFIQNSQYYTVEGRYVLAGPAPK